MVTRVINKKIFDSDKLPIIHQRMTENSYEQIRTTYYQGVNGFYRLDENKAKYGESDSWGFFLLSEVNKEHLISALFSDKVAPEKIEKLLDVTLIEA